MQNIKSDKLMSVLIGVSAFLMVMGALFQLQHYPYGNEIFSAGTLMCIVTTSIEISRLKKVVRKGRMGNERD